MATVNCPANVRETKIAFGFQPQADLATANTPTQLWSLTKTNTALAVVTPTTENDANDIGKGDEFPTQTFPSHMDVAAPIEKFASSEFLAWCFCFATGNATKTAAGGGFKYCATPSDPAVACINLTPFTYAEQIRDEPNSVIDRAAIGMVVNDFSIAMQSGPGRANCTVTANLVGTGKTQSPSAIAPWPAVTPEHFLNAASLALTILGTDYVANQSLISLNFAWTNNTRLDSGFFPGSGTQNGFAIRGRMEYNTRQCSLTFTARAQKGSPEYQKLISQTPGPISIKLTGPVIGAGPETHGIEITIPKAQFSAVVVGDADGIVTVQCETLILKDPAQPYITMCATCEKDGLLGLTTLLAAEAVSGAPVTLPVASADVPQSGGPQSFAVESADTWTASSSDMWITITAPAAGVTGNGIVEYLVAANDTAAARAGSIVVGDKTFAVNQAA